MGGKSEFGPKEHARRSERMGDQLRQVLGNLLEREVKDPRIGFATITAVDLSPDLRNARVYVSVLGDETKKQESMAGLAAATPFLRLQIAKRLNLRYTPAVEFHLDRTEEYTRRLDELIRRTHKKIGNRE
ncbi:MAG: 30S ribosome-binding factor RbfA [Acidobacteria bacterium]|nr:30S ribosome-binding factor RbfA [Acidobacteriota bacterium]